MTKSSPSIWQYVVTVKLAIFVAFSGSVNFKSTYHLMRKYLKISYMVSNREAQDSNITEYLPAVSCVAFNNDLKGAIHLLFLVSEKTFWVCWFVQMRFHKYQELSKKISTSQNSNRSSHKLFSEHLFSNAYSSWDV